MVVEGGGEVGSGTGIELAQWSSGRLVGGFGLDEGAVVDGGRHGYGR